MAEIKGDLKVCRTIDAARRVNQGLRATTITGAEQLELHSHYWQRVTAASTQDVILPDATTLPNGWSVVVEAKTSNINVKTYDAVTPVLRKTVTPDRAYEFTLVDNGTAAGVWYVNFLEEADTLATARFTATFDASTDWGAASGGYYTQVITQATHTRGTSPQVDVFEESGSDFVKVDLDELKVLANGDVELRVPEDPDCRFAGKVVMI
jgi:hypothetical protein